MILPTSFAVFTTAKLLNSHFFFEKQLISQINALCKEIFSRSRNLTLKTRCFAVFFAEKFGSSLKSRLNPQTCFFQPHQKLCCYAKISSETASFQSFCSFRDKQVQGGPAVAPSCCAKRSKSLLKSRFSGEITYNSAKLFLSNATLTFPAVLQPAFFAIFCLKFNLFQAQILQLFSKFFAGWSCATNLGAGFFGAILQNFLAENWENLNRQNPKIQHFDKQNFYLRLTFPVVDKNIFHHH